MFGILAGLGADLGWGAADFFAAISSRKIGNLLTFFWMQIIGFLIASIYLLTQLSSLNPESLINFLPRLTAVAFFMLVAYLNFYQALAKAQVSLVSPLGGCWGIVTAILSIIFYGEVLKLTQIWAIIMIISGILLISADWKKILTAKKAKFFNGAKEGLIAMLGWGIALFLVVPASKSLGWFLPAYGYRALSLFMLFIFLLFNKTKMKFPLEKKISIPLILVGVLDMLGHFSYNFGVSGAYAAIVAPVSSAFPLVTVLMAIIFLKEKLLVIQTLGIIAIIGGLILISI